MAHVLAHNNHFSTSQFRPESDNDFLAHNKFYIIT